MSCTACPSRRNSGFHAISTDVSSTEVVELSASCGATSRSVRCCSARAVPTGTVDFPKIMCRPRNNGTKFVTAERTKVISAAYEFFCCGVPTPKKWTCAKSAASWYDVVKWSRPEEICLRIRPSKPGSKNGVSPRERSSILCGSTSTPMTSCPNSAMHAACVDPRYPVPITDIRMPMNLRGSHR